MSYHRGRISDNGVMTSGIKVSYHRGRISDNRVTLRIAKRSVWHYISWLSSVTSAAESGENIHEDGHDIEYPPMPNKKQFTHTHILVGG